VDAGNQQRILGYFIEEAKEHLDTLEKGLLGLRSAEKDPESLNEMFRAAHSVKGGAAMLGFSSIQKTAHRLEDSFKVLKEHDVNVDQRLETLFLQGYDTLKDLIEQLQGPFGLRNDEAEKRVQASEPTFVELQSYLNQVVNGGSAPPPAATRPVEQAKAQGTVPPNFVPQVMDILKQMLQLFKQPDTPASRKQFQGYCKRLVQLGAGIKPWQELIQVSYKAIANPKNSYQALAPVVIKELKQGLDLLNAGKGSAIAISPALQQLATAPAASTTATPTKAPSTTATAASPKQITLTVEPKAAAKALIQAFDKKQLSQLVKLLVQATRASS
jgi:chemotaxis protein histidine kinase CheA